MTGVVMITKGCGGEGGGKRRKRNDDQNQFSIVALMVDALRRSMISCRVDRRDEVASAVRNMEIGWPTNVCHVAHVTFDRFNGFLGLPVEFEHEIPRKVPSARFEFSPWISLMEEMRDGFLLQAQEIGILTL